MDSLVVEGKVSIYCFVATAMVSLIVFLPGVGVDETIYKRNSLWVYPLHYILINVLLIKIYAENFYSIAWRASLLGFIFAIGLAITKWSDEYIFPFGIYICFLAMFHYSEFLSIAWSNPKSLSTDSFILNHSPQYFIGILTSWIEFGLEWWWFPGLKTMSPIIYIGVIICIFGELLRKGAMITAKTNFHHLVQNHKDPNHRLITQGVYNLCRHPSYCGWFIWAVGTQLVLVNPFCMVAYCFACWHFFYERVYIEEAMLIRFFGNQYLEYQKRVPRTGVPFVPGFKLPPA